jgi:exopolysaccharide biosynthesis operon protein EpsL
MAGAAAAQPMMEGEPPEEPSAEEREAEAEEESIVKPAAALPDRPVMLRVGGSLSWDSNIFRAPQARSERIRVGYAGLNVDKAYAQQRFRLDVTETAYRYENFGHLDFNALNYLGAWNWQLGPRIGGTLTATRAQSLVDYSEFRNPGQRNVRTTENFAAGADAWLFGGWHLLGGLSHVQNRYSVPFPEEGSYRASGGEGGVKYLFPSANWVTFTVRALAGRYVDRALDPVARLDDGFRRREAEGLVSWRMTGKSSLEGRLAHVDYRSNNFAERDFSGIAIRLRYIWQTTAKLAVNASFGREIEPWADISASHRVEQRVTLGPVWRPTARATLRLDAARAEGGFRDPLPGFAGTERRDEERSVQLEGEWRALRNLSLKAAVQRYRQSSTDPGANHSGNLVALGLSLLL